MASARSIVYDTAVGSKLFGSAVVSKQANLQENRPGMQRRRVGVEVRIRRELEDWERHLEAHGVALAVETANPFTRSPIIDAPYASVIVFRDPDNIQLELFAPAVTRDSA